MRHECLRVQQRGNLKPLVKVVVPRRTGIDAGQETGSRRTRQSLHEKLTQVRGPIAPGATPKPIKAKSGIGSPRSTRTKMAKRPQTNGSSGRRKPTSEMENLSTK